MTLPDWTISKKAHNFYFVEGRRWTLLGNTESEYNFALGLFREESLVAHPHHCDEGKVSKRKHFLCRT